MKILVIGSGGREHAMVWKLRQSAAVEKVWCAPGNGGISKDAECVPLDLKDLKAAADLASNLGVELTIVGPELPLAHGIADEFAKRGLAILGPSQKAAQLEGSKVFAKKFMERFKIPTASTYGIFGSPIDAYTSLCSVDWPLVVKADGLCAGKGVLVTSSPDEAAAFIDRLMEKNEFGDAGKHVLLEEGLTGRELSYIILMDGKGLFLWRRHATTSALMTMMKARTQAAWAPFRAQIFYRRSWRRRFSRRSCSRLWLVYKRGAELLWVSLFWIDADFGGSESPRIQLPARRSGDTGDIAARRF